MPGILVVDDEQEILEITQFALEARGYTVRTAASGEEALARLRETPPEFLLIDYRLKKMTGLEFLKAAREIQPGIPAIMITGLATQVEAIEQACREISGCSFMSKPLQMDQVIQRIEEMPHAA
ncbi:MAG: response regulator [Candidatus Omnitrophica bacterium CG11_big_fil_rev_8_21_14_0_20_64_10]|nr:MAG: response regulator [Candidatus Omnitrophica bacterium CG11_big_fil_rev_8_21_14_0_20_64_10]